MRDPLLSITIAVHGLSDWKSLPNVRRILRAVWQTQTFSSEEIANYWVINRQGRRERLSVILSNCWRELQTTFPAVSGNYNATEALDVMHFQILGKLRLHPHADADGKVEQALPLKRGEAMPDSTTLEGAFKLAHLIAKTKVLTPPDIFPSDTRRELVFYHPVTGQQVHYVSFMYRWNRLIAEDKAGGDKRFESLATGTPDVAQRMPDETIRRRLLRIVRERAGQLPPTTLMPATQVRRVPAGQRVPQPVTAPPSPPPGRGFIFDPRNP